ncbi:MAG: hypothetical protein HY791_00590 [Deltaproteobacteria bacterium]|nr:hypothetical protein [Deltaproteobacteria bacterium]
MDGGDVAVLSPTLSQALCDDALATIGQDARIGHAFDVAAKSLRLRNHASVGDVFADELVENQAQRGTLFPFPASALPVMPALPPAVPGSPPLTLAQGEVRRIGPSSLGEVLLRQGCRLELEAGEYDFASLDVGQDSRVEALGPVVVSISGRLAPGQKSYLGPAPSAPSLTARDVRLEVHGLNGASGNLHASPEAAVIGQKAVVRALILAPNGKLHLRQGANVRGAFFGKWVEVGQDAEVDFEGGFGVAECPGGCDDGNPCTLDSCSSGACVHQPSPTGISCANADACDGAETCDGAGQCVPGAPLVIDDGNPCTADGCDPSGGPRHDPEPTGASCSNANACDGDEACDGAGACLAGTPPVIDDGNSCTVDDCVPASGVTHVAASAGASCSNQDACDGEETCDGAGSCLAGSPIVVDDGNLCTADACDPSSGPSHEPQPAGTECANGDACDGAELCDGAGACLAGVPPTIDDRNSCTADSCDSLAGVIHAPQVAGASCANGDACDGVELCDSAGACLAGVPPTIDDGDSCTADSCDPLTGVRHEPIIACGGLPPDPSTPVAQPDAFDVVAGDNLSVLAPGVLENDLISEGAVAAVTRYPNRGLLLFALDGSFEYATEEGQPEAAESFDYELSIGSLRSVTTVYLNVVHLNEAPSVLNQAQRVAPVGRLYQHHIVAEDPDDDSVSLAYGLATHPDGMQISGADLTFVPTAVQVGTHPVVIVVQDPHGATGQSHFTLEVTDIQPSSIEAPPIDRTVATNLFDSMRFLVEGQPPTQVGAIGIDRRRAVWVRGRVADSSGSSLAGVEVSVLEQPEVGRTLTRGDGMFDLLANGGGRLTVQFSAPGWLSVDRSLHTVWQESRVLDDIVLVRADINATSIGLPASAIAVARGSSIEDARGLRTPSLIFLPSTDAFRLELGQLVPVGTLQLRITEYSRVDLGPHSLPATLPPGVKGRYVVEIASDGVSDPIVLSEPVPFWVENTLGAPVGTLVPAASYDHSAGVWRSTRPCRVVRVLGPGSLSQASLDIDGDGMAETDDGLLALGIGTDERQALAQLYPAGTSLLRAEVTHFSTYAFDGVVGARLDAGPPAGFGIQVPRPSVEDLLTRTVPLEPNTDNALVHRSDRVLADRLPNEISVPLTLGSVPSGLESIKVEVEVAGRRLVRELAAGANLTAAVGWDGKDAFGRLLQGAQPAHVSVRYRYPAMSQWSSLETTAAFGLPLGGGTFVQQTASDGAFELAREYRVQVGGWDQRAVGLGGWSYFFHHAYDPGARIIHQGDGQSRAASELDPVISTVAGTGVPGYSGDGGPGVLAELSGPVAVSSMEDGSVLIADRGNAQIRKVDPQGTITTISSLNQLSNGSAEFAASIADLPGWLEVAGTWRASLEPGAPHGIAYFATTSVDAELAQDVNLERFAPRIDAGIALFRFQAFAWAPAGSARVAVEYHAEDGTVLDVFDSGGLAPEQFWQFVEDIRVPPAGARKARVRLLGSATGTGDEVGFDDVELAPFDGSTELAWPEGVAAGAASVFASDSELNVILQLMSGTSRVFAGGGVPADDLGDGQLATEARLQIPGGLAVAPDGSVLVADSAHDRVRRIDPGGTITTIAGAGVPGYSGDGGSALEAALSFPRGVAADTVGNVFIADTYNHCIRRVSVDGNIETIAGTGVAGYSGDGADARLATFSTPESVAVARDGSVYVADTGNNAIRKVAPSGLVTTIAGGPDVVGGDGPARAALLVEPSGIWVANDDDDTLFVAERGAHRVRRIAPAWPSFRFEAPIALPAADGVGQLVFDGAGRHLRTLGTPSGTELRSFEYRPTGELTASLDGDATTFVKDLQGKQVNVTTPNGFSARMDLSDKGRVVTLTRNGDTAFDFRTHSPHGRRMDELRRIRFLANAPTAAT